VGETAVIDVKNAKGYQLCISSIRLDGQQTAQFIIPGISEPQEGYPQTGNIEKDSDRIQIKGLVWGSAMLLAFNMSTVPQKSIVLPDERLVVNVRDPRPNNYHPTDAHHHEPVKEPDEWNKVCEEAAKDPDLTFVLKGMARCKASPPTVAEGASFWMAAVPPIRKMAQEHLDWYLRGRGGVVNEDENLKSWIKGDSNARRVISRRIREQRRGNESPVRVMFEFEQGFYDDEEARQSFGTIDKLEVEADFVMGKVEIWFEDTYEWHPPYSQYTKPKRCPDIKPRNTHFLHAALVQMKTRGAKDFQMRGKAKFDMKLFPNL
jgi:hypothetical protein